MILSCLERIIQRDVKALAAYSSIRHISFLLIIFVFLILRGKLRGEIMMLLHGFISCLIFYFIGEFYRSSGCRLFYYLLGLLNINLRFGLIFVLIFLVNGGIPFCLLFYVDFLGVAIRIGILKGLIVFVFFYYFFIFYYCIFVIESSVVGKRIVNFTL